MLPIAINWWAGLMMDGDSARDWQSMTIDDLLALREEVQETLRERLKAKRAELDRRLRSLGAASVAVESPKRPRRRRVKDAHA
jgi:hypothetical protein